MTVMWLTKKNLPSIVRYGLQKSKLSFSSTGVQTTYSGGGWNGWIHTAKMTNLIPGTSYFYQVGSGTTNQWSKIFSFKTEPLNRNRKITIARYMKDILTFTICFFIYLFSIADMGNFNSENTIKQIQNRVESGSIDFLLHNGDISYADGEQVTFTLATIYFLIPY